MSSQPPLPPAGSTQGGGAFPTRDEHPPQQDQTHQQGGVGSFTINPNLLSAVNALTQSHARAVNPEISAGMRLYLQIWGQPPPGWNQKDHGYIGQLVTAGMNLFEIALHEMSKPAFQFTQFYRDRYAQFAQQASSVLGRT